MSLRWTKMLYSTGVEFIDAQHRRLFALMNTLIETLGPGELSQINKALAEMEAYARRHFGCEERAMAKGGCRALCLNQSEHREFLERVTRLKEKFAMHGPLPDLLQETKFFVLGWVRTHIQAVDLHLRCTIGQGIEFEEDTDFAKFSAAQKPNKK